MPGGQHGGAREAGFIKPVASQPDVDDNLYAFAMRHFFGVHKIIPRPNMLVKWNEEFHHFSIQVWLVDPVEPETNEVFYSVNRHPDYSMQMEFDEWKSVPMEKKAGLKKKSVGTSYTAEIIIDGNPKTVDFISVHKHTAEGTTLTVSSPEVRVAPRAKQHGP